MQLRHFSWALPFLAAFAALAILGSQAHAQCGNGLKVQWEAWVDPVRGDDATATVDQIGVTSNGKDHPFMHINAAISRVANSRVLGQNEGIVHVLPGLYSWGSNQEVFPIQMSRGVHLQGAGAKETVLRVRDTDPTRLKRYPLRNSTAAQRFQPHTVAVDFGSANFGSGVYQVPDFESGPMLDGFTIQGAEIQVSFESELGIIRGRVSNCVFDMREKGAEQLLGPDFGILICAVYDPNHTYIDSDAHEKHYVPHHLHAFNNTFIQGSMAYHSDTGIGMDLAKLDAVGICDFAETLDQDGALRGVNRHDIQNNLFRTLDGNPRAAMLGIDQGDAHVLISSAGPLPRPTNAFDAGMARTTSVPNQRFTSLIVNTGIMGLPAIAPLPVVDLAPADPGFIGEYLSLQRGTLIRDFRLLPDSVLVDRGASPAYVASCGTIGALNQLDYSESRGSLKESFDFDGEGNGNPRIRGADVDIGMDETDVLEVAGSYGNDTKSHYQPWNPTLGFEIPGVPIVPAGSANRSYITPNAGPLLHFINIDFRLQNVVTGIPATPPLPWAWTSMPGSVGVPNTTLFPPFSIWLDFVGYVPQNVSTTSTAQAWVNWQSAQVHAFGEFVWANANDDSNPPVGPIPAFTSYFNTQVVILNAAGALVASNLQSEYF
ncbi:MAG: hypothetical protein IPJ19_03545 [Planctomycetes bacterium]|nr:hypothetical protein [Planctomycetota bacterium]